MRYLGIDFGHKKIGLALSDGEGNLAYPYSVIPTAGVENAIQKICDKEEVSEIVIGDTKNLKGEVNSVSGLAQTFAEKLKTVTDLPVFWQTEVFTSREAERIIGDDKDRDARAAAIMLQSYLDLQNRK